MVRFLTRQNYLKAGMHLNCNEFTGKDEWSPNSPDINPMDYHVWGVMPEHCKTTHSKPNNTNVLKKVLQLIWNQLPVK